MQRDRQQQKYRGEEKEEEEEEEESVLDLTDSVDTNGPEGVLLCQSASQTNT